MMELQMLQRKVDRTSVHTHLFAKGVCGLFLTIMMISCVSNTTFFGKVSCNDWNLHSKKMFTCDASLGLADINRGRHTTYNFARQQYPQQWAQLGANQYHDTVFAGKPELLSNFWAAPLTGMEYQRLRKANDVYPNNGGQTWASITAVSLSNVMGVSVAQGLVFAQLSSNAIYAIDASTGDVVWNQDLVNVAGMGQTVVGTINNRLMVFVPVGDASYNLTNTVRFKHKQRHNRGAQFGGLFAFDALTGEPIWEFHTEAAARPTPVLRDGKLYLATSGGDFYVLNAGDGALLGSSENPGGGYPGLASINWYETSAGKLYILYGTLRPRNIIAVDVTRPSAPALAWSYSPPGAAANSTGDTPVAIDPVRGVVMTTVFTATSVANEFELMVLALDADTGLPLWTTPSGKGPNIPGFKASVPMIHQDTVFVGNSLSQTLQAFNIDSGQRLWVTDLRASDDAPQRRRRPGGAGVMYEGKFIHAEGNKIRTLDPTTGEILNVFKTSADNFAIWAITQPVIVGGQMYLGSHSGWVFSAPVDYITTEPGVAQDPGFAKPIPLRSPHLSKPTNRPSDSVAGAMPKTWTAYAGGQTHNGVHTQGLSNVSWQTPLNDALPLTAPPRDASIYGEELATNMTHLAFGVGSGVSPVQGMVIAGTGRNTVDALNAKTGEMIWSHKSINATYAQPLVTEDAVIASSGDQFFALASTARFSSGASNALVFGNFEYVTSIERQTGKEQWTVFSGTGTSAMTPLLHAGNLYWITGDGSVWAVDAATGAPVSPFMDADYKASIKLGGFNVLSAANVYHRSNAGDLMIAGAAMPHQVVGIDLASAAVVWQQDFVPLNIYDTGFATSSVAVDQARGLAIGTVLVDGDAAANTSTILAYAVDTQTGALVWTQAIGSGSLPIGYSAPTGVLDADTAYFNNPLTNTVVALDLQTGAVNWQTLVSGTDGRPSWGPGVIVGSKLIQPVGSTLVTLDTATGNLLNTLPVGGAFMYNNPSVAGSTLYIGNSWGWVLAYPLGEVTGDPSDG